MKCFKCGEEKSPLPAAPYPGEPGKKALASICADCWKAWQKFSVMVINDYKLKPFLPKDRGILEQNMQKFLFEAQTESPPVTLSGQGKEITFDNAPSAGKSLRREDVADMLEKIFDPEIPVNIYDLGLIYDIALHGKDGNDVTIKMSLTSKHCPAAQSLPEDVRQTLSRMPGVGKVTVEVVWDPPWDKSRVSEEGRQILGT